MQMLIHGGIAFAGLGLFLFGMGQMSASLKEVAGNRFRRVLGAATKTSLAGAATGGLLGSLIRGTATTLMVVGLVNAGLLALRGAVPMVVGANVGATLSMQLVSFKLINVAYFAIGLGYLLFAAAKQTQLRQAGQFLLGFGLMFLGLDLMAGAIEPYRDDLQPWLSRIDGSRWDGLLIGILMATLVTGVIQSSGAVIGMSFALIAAGAITRLDQVFPIILGAHIGTCVTPILGSLGARPDARRVASANLLFNVFNVALAAVAAPLFLMGAARSSSDLLRQAANLHTMVHVVAALVFLPFTGVVVLLLRRLFRNAAEPEGSHLHDALLAHPENALVAVLRELRRMATVCDELYSLARDNLFGGTRKTTRQIEGLEQVSDETRRSAGMFLSALATQPLSRRQAIFIQHLDDVLSHLERINDHIEKVDRIAQGSEAFRKGHLSPDIRERLEATTVHIDKLLSCLHQALDPDERMEFPTVTISLQESMMKYEALAEQTQAWFAEEMEAKRLHPLVGLRIKDVLGLHDRIAAHVESVSDLLSDKAFFVKASKLSSEIQQGESDG